MWFTVDEDAVQGASHHVGAAAELIGGVPLTGLADAVRDAMPGAQSVVAATNGQSVLLREVSVVSARCTDEGRRLRLAATQYAAADTVVRACSAAGRSLAGVRVPTPQVSEPGP